MAVRNGVFTVWTRLSHSPFWCGALSVEKNHSIDFFETSPLILFQLMEWYKAQISLHEFLWALSEYIVDGVPRLVAKDRNASRNASMPVLSTTFCIQLLNVNK
jgi:hypothetical protein